MVDHRHQVACCWSGEMVLGGCKSRVRTILQVLQRWRSTLAKVRSAQKQAPGAARAGGGARREIGLRRGPGNGVGSPQPAITVLVVAAALAGGVAAAHYMGIFEDLAGGEGEASAPETEKRTVCRTLAEAFCQRCDSRPPGSCETEFLLGCCGADGSCDKTASMPPGYLTECVSAIRLMPDESCAQQRLPLVCTP